LSDRFDYIFVDEYQDTSPAIVRVLIDIIAKTTKTTIGMFGDSMQGIYKDGVGDVDRYIEAGALRKIEKEDNFRCAEQVVKFLNALRLDTLRQEVALKFRADGGMESLAERQGSVTLIYSIAPEGAKKDKSTYLPKLRRLIEAANHSGQAKYLMLTNKAIAGEVGFPQLYEIFTGRYGQERGDQMERVLNVLQFDELVRLCALYRDKEYNELINRVKQNGFQINSKKDKENLHSNIEAIAKSNLSAVETMEAAVRSGLIAPSETHRGFVEYKNEFLADLEKDEAFQTFLCDKAEGNNTVIRMIKAGRAMDEYLFDDLSKKDKKRTFYQDLFSNAAKFVEVLNYFDYMNDEKPYVTMHKTKGTGIPEVVVVLDEYYWREHEFKNILTSDFGEAQNMNRKLVYVACSRAINHLTCVRIISSDEEKALLAADFCSIHKFDYEKL
jgi:DNA helicase-2/ATP-dependent DNA helicase PcrA